MGERSPGANSSIGPGVRGARGKPRSPVANYLLSFAILLGAIALRWLIDPWMGDALPLVTVFGAVAAAVWLGGLGPAIATAVLGYFACNYLFISPRGQLADLGSAPTVVGLVAYLFTCALIVAIGEAMRMAQRRAGERQELLRVTLGSIGDAVVTTDNDGRVSYLNSVAAELTGWRAEEASGRPLDEVFRIVDEETREPLESPALRALREGVAVGLTNHTVLLAKDGRELSIDDSAAPIRDDRGYVSGCVLIFRDVSERRHWAKLEGERMYSARLLAAIVESSEDAIVSKSLDGVIRTWNASAERLFGWSAAEAVGRHISLVIPPDRISEEDRIVASLKAGERVDHFETVRQRKDGSRIAVSLTISPIRDDSGRIVGASKIVRDVTERKRLEDDLRQLAVDLGEADRRKNQFLATLSHELRNPLAPLRSMLDVLKRGGDETALPEALDTMERQLEQLIRLVDDLLDLNRITHDRIELRRLEVDLEEVVRQAMDGARPLAESAGHSMSLSLPPEPIRLLADPVRLVQVFGNLLNNACKYTAPGGAIDVAVERRESEAVVTIRDTGAGIPAGQLERIFEMFTQVERTLEQSQGGLGIGLTLVKRLVELHGGSIAVTSAGENLGSQFVVRLPIVAAPAAELVSPPAAAGTARARRVLVVDDNRDAAESLATLLRLTGFGSLLAHDGETALEMMERERPDVVLLDIGLPRIHGYEVCRRARETAWGRAMRIIALTGWGQDEDRSQSEAAGFDDHLVKPVDFDELLKLLG